MTPFEPDDRLAALGNQLVQVHIWLREELALLRDGVGAVAEGRGATTGDLRAHCLTFCSALTRHHSGEDRGAFPVLAQRFPELRPVLAELVRDHDLVATTLGRLEELCTEAALDPAAARRVQAEADELAALLETHFLYEERKLVAALDALDHDREPQAWRIL